jgi:hypothetical protein
LTVGRWPSLQLGHFTLTDPVIHFAQDRKGAFASSDFGGVIGGELLRRFKVVFDYAHKRMILEPNAHLADRFDYDMSGIRLRAEGADLKQLKVIRLVENSPAVEAGLREGDLISAIDGRPAARLYPHMLGGTIMLFFGAANLYIGASRQHFKYHKFIGRVYLIGGSLGVIAALSINLTTAHKSDAAGIFTNSALSTATLALAGLAPPLWHIGPFATNATTRIVIGSFAATFWPGLLCFAALPVEFQALTNWAVAMRSSGCHG